MAFYFGTRCECGDTARCRVHPVLVNEDRRDYCLPCLYSEFFTRERIDEYFGSIVYVPHGNRMDVFGKRDWNYSITPLSGNYVGFVNTMEAMMDSRYAVPRYHGEGNEYPKCNQCSNSARFRVTGDKNEHVYCLMCLYDYVIMRYFPIRHMTIIKYDAYERRMDISGLEHLFLRVYPIGNMSFGAFVSVMEVFAESLYHSLYDERPGQINLFD